MTARNADRHRDASPGQPGRQGQAPRARRILDGLRWRYGETARPQPELDDIERLLKDY